MKTLLIIISSFFIVTTAQAYQIGNSFATLVSCDFDYNSDYNRSGYTGTYRTTNGNIYRIWFGNKYCPY